ncbi:MAG: hypothetical protein MUC88_07375 [Planctomycetes bacterium]|jgi:hypothetical protein|nr:hypothetical protein [Planctomycetota bacterium]
MRRIIVVLSVTVLAWGYEVRAEGVSCSGTLSRSGVNTDGFLQIATVGPAWHGDAGETPWRS